jgi:hypothetical protein
LLRFLYPRIEQSEIRGGEEPEVLRFPNGAKHREVEKNRRFFDFLQVPQSLEEEKNHRFFDPIFSSEQRGEKASLSRPLTNDDNQNRNRDTHRGLPNS